MYLNLFDKHISGRELGAIVRLIFQELHRRIPRRCIQKARFFSGLSLLALPIGLQTNPQPFEFCCADSNELADSVAIFMYIPYEQSLISKWIT